MEGKRMHNTQLRCSLLSIVFLLLCTACGSAIPPTMGSTTSRSTTSSVSSSPLTTSCPAAGKARAAVMPPLSSGHHTAVVYATNDDLNSMPDSAGFLKRYDAVTATTTQIVREANTSITSAHLSADGQWILFYSRVGGVQAQTTALQLVRIDGKYLQTLFCFGKPYANFLWSPDQKLVAFGVAPDVEPPTQYDLPGYYLLNLSSGEIHSS